MSLSKHEFVSRLQLEYLQQVELSFEQLDLASGATDIDALRGIRVGVRKRSNKLREWHVAAALLISRRCTRLLLTTESQAVARCHSRAQRIGLCLGNTIHPEPRPCRRSWWRQPTCARTAQMPWRPRQALAAKSGKPHLSVLHSRPTWCMLIICHVILIPQRFANSCRCVCQQQHMSIRLGCCGTGQVKDAQSEQVEPPERLSTGAIRLVSTAEMRHATCLFFLASPSCQAAAALVLCLSGRKSSWYVATVDMNASCQMLPSSSQRLAASRCWLGTTTARTTS